MWLQELRRRRAAAEALRCQGRPVPPELEDETPPEDFSKPEEFQRFTNDSPGALTMEQAIERHTTRLAEEHQRIIQRDERKARKAALAKADREAAAARGEPPPQADDDFTFPPGHIMAGFNPYRARMAAEAEALARQGRGNDTEIAHVAEGELVLPEILQSPEVMAAVRRVAGAHGIPMDRLRVGSARNSINPNTGIAEFGGFGREQFLLSDPYQARLPTWREARGEELFDPKYRPQPPVPSIVQGPVQQTPPNIIDDPNMMPSLRGQAIASLPTDRAAQTRAIAHDLFPDNSFNEVADRFGEHNGRRYYTDFDGAKYYADPALKAPTSMDNLQQNAKYAAGLIGPAIPAATTATGSALTHPLIAPLYAGVGVKLRSDLAERFTGEQQPQDQILREAGQAMADKAARGSVPNYLRSIGAWPFKR